ncbi:hypothetical protein EB796_006062 [Bugula neritina]|uniref:Uncharacterized protein n=1 Tax=Bugula neritina TaxID=10212 RepID=A0A7J7KAC9_BUGNE|nr:hypothetical protein EB796_006062 [Bugula neritina]
MSLYFSLRTSASCIFCHCLNVLSTLNKVNRQYALLFDAGCGPGLMSTVFLAPYFDKVLGVENLLVPDRAGNSQQQTK